MKSILILLLCLAGHLAAEQKSGSGTSVKTVNLGDKLIFPKVSFENTQLVEVVDFLKLRSREILGQKNNINFVLLGDAKTFESVRIKKMELKNVSLNTVLKTLCKENNLVQRIDQEAIVITPKGYKKPPIILKDDKGSGSKKLDSITMGTISMDGTDIGMCAMFLQMQSKQYDADKKGLKFLAQGDDDQLFQLRVRSFSLHSASLRAALGYICEQSGCQYSVKGDTVTITPLTKKSP